MNAALRQSKASTTDGGKGQSDSISKQGNEGHESNMTRLSAGSENIDEPNAESERANKARLDGEIKSLLERQHSAPCTSEPILKGRWRKERKLGRAPSTASSSSASASFRQAKSMDAGVGTDPGGPMDDGVPLPSQQLTYETPDAQEYRARMSKKMGTVLMDDNIGTRVQSLGVVRDVESDDFSGVGGRVRGRQRTAKNQI